MESEKLQGNDHRSAKLHSKLEAFYGMPSEIWTDVHWEANGYYGCRDSKLDRHDTWFRYLIKQLIKEPSSKDELNYTYTWFKMAFFTTWSQAGPKSILCLDCPQEMTMSVRGSLDNACPDHFLADPYSFHQIIIRGIVNVYDNSIWRIRDVVRHVEKHRAHVNKPEPDYDHLHELARHVIHSTETLIVSTHQTEQIMLRQRTRMDRSNAPEEELRCMRQIGDNLMFYWGMIHAFKCRSESMQARHQNEISLTFNTVAQYQSQLAAVDAAAMRVIAVLSAAFLPATFVSAIFSMSFFNNGGGGGTQSPDTTLSDSGGGGGDGWSLSSKFWIYWAFAIPLTVIAMVLLCYSNKILRKLKLI
ncbi:hypothetical protein TWF694_002702 [Orbilia ellipsospora]